METIRNFQAMLNSYNKLKQDAEEFETYISNNQLHLDKSYDAVVKNPLKYIGDGLENYSQAVEDKHPYIKEDNRAMKDMLKDVEEQLNKRKQKYYT